MAVQLQVLKAKTQEPRWYWHIISVGNGEIMASSQLYKSKQSAIDSMRVIKSETGAAVLFDMTVDPPARL